MARSGNQRRRPDPVPRRQSGRSGPDQARPVRQDHSARREVPAANPAAGQSEPAFDLKTIESEILSLATEDYQGLWEVRSHVEQSLGAWDNTVTAAVARAAGNLLRRGLIEIYRGSLRHERVALVPKEEAQEALSETSAWHLPENDLEAFLLTATPKGERAYASRSARS
jgi:hypothetical protein